MCPPLLQALTEGVSNLQVCCHLDSDTERDDAVVIRVVSKNTDNIVDRDMEKLTMRLLHTMGMGAELYASFTNGIAYQFLPGNTLDVQTVADPHISR